MKNYLNVAANFKKEGATPSDITHGRPNDHASGGLVVAQYDNDDYP